MSMAVSRPRSEGLHLVLMGVAGCGKSSVGAALSERLGIPYVDGDDLHPPANIAKMASGQPLTDEDRWPWLTLVARRLGSTGSGGPASPVIIGCSALKRRYRDHIRSEAGVAVTFVHLAGSRALIETRLGARTGHFMPASLLDSQFAALEPPQPDERAVTVSIDQPLAAIVDDIASALTGDRP